MPKKKVGSSPGGVPEKVENEKWTLSMDDALITALISEDNIGNRVGGTFTPTAYNNILNELFVKLGKVLTKQQVKNRLKTIKKNFNECYDIFKGGMSGFSWNPTTNMWGAETEVWDSLIEVKPTTQKWKNTPIHSYERLSTLFGTDRASGLSAETAKEKARRWTAEKEQHADVEDDQDNYIVEDDTRNDEETSQATVKSTSFSSSKKRKRETSLDETLKMLAHSAQESNEILKERNRLMQMSFELNNREEEVYAELKRLGVDSTTRMKAYSFLVGNPGRIGAFFGCAADDRLEYLTYQMHSYGGSLRF